jgi:hypothetical protein
VEPIRSEKNENVGHSVVKAEPNVERSTQDIGQTGCLLDIFQVMLNILSRMSGHPAAKKAEMSDIPARQK